MANTLASILGLVGGIFLIIYSLKALHSGSVSVPIQRARYTRHWYGTGRIRWISTINIDGKIAKLVSNLYLFTGMTLIAVVIVGLSPDYVTLCCIGLMALFVPLNIYWALTRIPE